MTDEPAPAAYPGPEAEPLDYDRMPELIRKSIEATPSPEDREWFNMLLATGARIHLDLFDEDGFASLAIGEPTDPGVIHLVWRTHWTALAPARTDLEDVEAHCLRGDDDQ